MDNQELKSILLTRLVCLAPYMNFSFIESKHNLPRGAIYKVIKGEQKMSDRVYTGLNEWMRYTYELVSKPLDHLQKEIK